MHDLPPMFFEVQPHTDAPASCSLWALAQPAPEPGHTPELARSQARAAARNRLCEQLAQRWGCAPEALALSDVRGQAPQLSRWPATLPQAVRDDLAARGHKLDVLGPFGVSTGIVATGVVPGSGTLRGGADVRRERYVFGW